jgi:hypothetical protein
LDQLSAPEGKELGEVKWLLHLPKDAKADGGAVTAANGKSWLRCRQLLPGGAKQKVEASLEAAYQQASFAVRGGAALLLVHAIELGDGEPPEKPAAIEAKASAGGGCEVTVAGRKFVFGAGPEFKVAPAPAPQP